MGRVAIGSLWCAAKLAQHPEAGILSVGGAAVCAEIRETRFAMILK